MHPEQIKAAIRMTGTTPTDLGRSLGVTHTCVAHVISGRGVSARVAQRIAQVTGIPIAKLWPGKYQRLV